MAHIENFYDKIPKSYRNSKFGVNKKLKINNLFRAIVLSPSGGGKSNLIVSLIADSPGIYGHIHLIAKSPNQPLYNFLRDKLGGLISIYPVNEPPSLESIKVIPDTPQLVIIDDYSNDAKFQKNIFADYFIKGRHKHLSVAFLCHSYFACEKMIRLNAEYVFILKANSIRDLKMILKDFNIPNVSLEDFKKAYEDATKEKGQFLFINSLDNTIRKNFTGEIYNDK